MSLRMLFGVGRKDGRSYKKLLIKEEASVGRERGSMYTLFFLQRGEMLWRRLCDDV